MKLIAALLVTLSLLCGGTFAEPGHFGAPSVSATSIGPVAGSSLTVNAATVSASAVTAAGVTVGGNVIAGTVSATSVTAITVNGLTVVGAASGSPTLTIMGTNATRNKVMFNNNFSAISSNSSAQVISGPGGTYTFQGTDTYVGRITTDTLTNKTLAAGSNVITGLGIANFGGVSGTASSTSYLRGDGVWTSQLNGVAVSASTISATSVTASGYVSGTFLYGNGINISNPMAGFIKASQYGFDATCTTGNGAKLNSLFSIYPYGFLLLLDVPGGCYLFGDTPIDDHGVSYGAWGLGRGDGLGTGVYPTVVRFSNNSNDLIRVRANGVQWREMTFDGSTVSATTVSPSVFVLGYAGGAGGAARWFRADVDVVNIPGRFLDWVQGVHPVLNVRGSGGYGEFIYGRGANEAGAYAGGNDQQNGVFDVALTNWHNWTMNHGVSSSLGAEEFVFWKQYNAANGIHLAQGGNHGRIYPELTVSNSGVPYKADAGGNNIVFMGGLQDSDFVSRTWVSNTELDGRASNYTVLDDEGVWADDFHAKQITVHDSTVGGGNFVMNQTGAAALLVTDANTSRNYIIKEESHLRATNGHLQHYIDHLGFRDNINDSPPFYLQAMTHRVLTLVNIPSSSTLPAGSTTSIIISSTFPVTDSVIGGISISDTLDMKPGFQLTKGLIYQAYIPRAGQIQVDVSNITSNSIAGSVSGAWYLTSFKVTQ